MLPTQSPPPANMPLSPSHEDNSGEDSRIIAVIHLITSPKTELVTNPAHPNEDHHHQGENNELQVVVSC